MNRKSKKEKDWSGASKGITNNLFRVILVLVTDETTRKLFLGNLFFYIDHL